MKKIGHNLTIRTAPNSYGEPVCIASEGGSDESLGLTIYMKGGLIVGVVVVDPSMGVDRLMTTACGLVPTDEYDDRLMDSKRRQT